VRPAAAPLARDWVARGWNRVGTRVLPFADAPVTGLPLGRLLRLSLFQIAVGVAAVLVISTLDRVMIVELHVPATQVAAMIALPLLLAPLRAVIGHRSDTHRSALGWRRLPFLWIGAMLQFGGLALMPFALIVLSGDAGGPRIAGPLAAALAFLLVGLGMHTVQTVGLALATDLAPSASCPRVTALLCAAMLGGMVLSAPLFGLLLRPFSEFRLIQVLQGTSLVTLGLNAAALWKQESRRPGGWPGDVLVRRDRPPALRAAWAGLDPRLRRLPFVLAVALGTAGFSMQDVLLEPYGGQVLRLPVSTTTSLTALLALGGLSGFVAAAWLLARGTGRLRLAGTGLVAGALSLLAVLAAGPLGSLVWFACGTLGLGFAAALFETGMLTSVMELAAPDRAGLSLGLWGAVQATAAGLSILSSGMLRDLVADRATVAAGYGTVYALEIGLLLAALAALAALRARTAPRAQRVAHAPGGRSRLPGPAGPAA